MRSRNLTTLKLARRSLPNAPYLPSWKAVARFRSAHGLVSNVMNLFSKLVFAPSTVRSTSGSASAALPTSPRHWASKWQKCSLMPERWISYSKRGPRMSEAAPSPLAGKRIVVTRAEEQSDSLLKALAGKGAVPLLLPLLEFAAPEDAFPLNNAVANFAQFDWVIFTSQNGVRAVLERVTTLDPPVIPQPGKTRIAVVGPATADAIRQFGFSVDHIASSHNGLALAAELRGSAQNRRVLLPRR